MDIITRINGLDDLEKTFRNLSRTSQNRVFRPALRAGGNIVRKSTEDNIKAMTSGESTGFLAKNIRVYQLKNYRGMIRCAVRARKGAVYSNKRDAEGEVRAGKVLGVLEYGKKNQPPLPVLRKAIKENTSAVLAEVRDEVRARMPQAIEDAKK